MKQAILRPNFNHLRHHSIGVFIETFRKESNIDISDITSEAHMSNTTYYKVIAGYDYPLNYYLRLLTTFFEFCDSARFMKFLSGFEEVALRDGEEEMWGRRNK
ncbi:MAG: hypothetical protein RSA92_02245 [Bacteroidaceae bacterium]